MTERQLTQATPETDNGPAVAVVGMAGRFPGSAEVRDLWRSLRAGGLGISRFDEAELRANGVPDSLLADPAYVRAGSVLEGIDLFDAGFFGYTPREAQLLDPQQRLFLETCWHALEDAAADPARFDGSIGVVAGSALSSYLLHNLAVHPAVLETAGEVAIAIANDKDSLATRTAHVLDLTGPCYSVQSYCSTSLVAVSAACSTLVSGEADMMLAGGVTVSVPHRVGYLHQEAGMTSPDGLCRPFDASAQGTPVGSGVGVVALKRLEDAEADGDRIYAVIRGWAVNNDGADKVGFTAPGVRGQAAVVSEALASAGLGPADIDYVETHGTATPLGDAAEISSLQRVFDVPAVDRCLIGSAKSNLGHLDRAAGVTGLIKTVLSLHREEIPPTLHFERPSPQLERSGEKLGVVTSLTPWPRRPERIRRAGVSAFGMGGTNAHVVLEEAAPADDREERLPPRAQQLLVWSARSEDAAARTGERLAAALSGDDLAAEGDLGDVAYTLQTGRAVFEHRRCLVTGSAADAVDALGGQEAAHHVLSRRDATSGRPVGFLLAGVGEQYRGMVAGLHRTEPVFAAALDACVAELRPHLGTDPVAALVAERTGGGDDLARLLGRADDSEDSAALARPEIVQPAVFAVDYALGTLLMSWGIRPTVLAGYSVGEFAAACLAGALTLPEAAGLVAVRATLIAGLPPGAMAAVPLSAASVTATYSPRTSYGVDIAAHNGPAMSVISGPVDAVRALTDRLTSDGLPFRPLRTSHAFHSQMMRPVAAELTDWARENLRPTAPRVPYLSNVSGRPVTEQQLADPGYWARHMCSAVKFSDMLRHLLAGSRDALLEIGPGQSLGAMARNHPDCPPESWPLLIPTLPSEADPASDEQTLARAVAQLWLAGADVDWDAYHEGREPRKVSLPGYPFARDRYWIDPPDAPAADRGAPAEPSLTAPDGRPAAPAAGTGAEILVPRWTPAPLDAAGAATAPDGPLWVLADDSGLAAAVAASAAAQGRACLLVRPGDAYAAGDRPVVRPGEPADWQALLADAGAPSAVLHLWGADASTEHDPERALLLGHTALCALAPVLGTAPARVVVVTDSARAVLPGERPVPARAAVHGTSLVVPQEYPSLDVRTLDVALAADGIDAAADAALAELGAGDRRHALAVRGARRSALDLVPAADADADAADAAPALTVGPDGVVLVTGGLGEVGLLLAGHLGRDGATVVLTGRRPLPAEDSWDGLLADDGTDPALAARLRGLRRLAESGVGVEYAVADVTDEAALRPVVDGLVDRFGRIDAVVHLAAVTSPDHFGPLALLDADVRDIHFTAKLHGTAVLERVLAGQPVGHCLLFSSVSTVLGGLGFAGYAAANACLDAVPYRHAGSATHWFTVNWDTWAATAAALDGQDVGATQVQHSLTEEQALAALDRVLAAPAPRTVVSAGDLEARAAQWLGGGTDATAPGGPDDPDTLVRPAGDRFPRPALAQAYVPPSGQRERRLAEVWEDVLGIEGVGSRDNFADLGGTSLMALQLVKRIQKTFGIAVSPVSLFEAPTVQTMAALLDRTAGTTEPEAAPQTRTAPTARTRPRRDAPEGEHGGVEPIAVVGLACRFPGAPGPEEFWRNLADGVESVTRFTEDELRASGVPETEFRSPDYVPVKPVLDDIKGFDAAFFGYSARDAVITDPQHRLMLEICWEALDDGGYGAEHGRGRVGVFAGSNVSTYLGSHLSGGGAIEGEADIYASLIGNDKDSLATGISYKLGLTGPSMSVQTFCSTALVATHLACQSLRSGECELALAGGVAVHVPDRTGHLYLPGGMETRDGHVRTFDADASGTLFGDGAGAVLLKRLSDAIADGDHVHAVIRGSAVNNDGSLKVGYTAPSVVGQARVVSDALANAGVEPGEIGYVECHGTATELGDPIEVTALTKAFGDDGPRGRVPIGSVKTNIGHLAAAAGASGLIKTVLSLRNRRIPPSLHFTRPNPDIDFAAGPFHVNTTLAEWTVAEGRRRLAGVNSLGMGGTNVHVVLEEAPDAPARETGDDATRRRHHVVPVSGRTPTAADESVRRLRAHLADPPGGDAPPLAEVAFTAQTGRAVFEHRRAMVAASTAGLTGADGADPALALARHEAVVDRPVAFLIAGVGEQYPGMVGELYRREPEFTAAVDECAEILRPLLDADVVPLLTGPRPASADPLLAALGRDRGAAEDDGEESPLNSTEIAQPAVFVAEYALARLLESWGVRPTTMLGYSLGEYVAACLSGVLTLTDALRLVAFRARLIGGLPAGALLAVALPQRAVTDRIRQWEAEGIDLAAVNGPDLSVVGGEPAAVEAFAARLTDAGIAHRRLATTHAFHTRMLEPAREALTDWVRDHLTPQPPTVPYISCLTGRPVTADLVTDPGYWARHMVSPVRFADGLTRLLADPDPAFLEIGAGRSLGAMARSHPDCPPERGPLVLATLPAAADPAPDDRTLADGLAGLWLTGVPVDWHAHHGERRPRRVPLPSYPFERTEYWLRTGADAPARPAPDAAARPSGAVRRPDGTLVPQPLPLLPEDEWLHVQVWRQTAPRSGRLPAARWLVLAGARDDDPDGAAVADELTARLGAAGGSVVVVRPGDQDPPPRGGRLPRTPEGDHLVRPGDAAAFRALLRELKDDGGVPDRVVHLWSRVPGTAPDGAAAPEDALPHGLHTLAALARAMGDSGLAKWGLDVVASGTAAVTGTERLHPALSTLLAAVRVIPLEYPGVSCRLVDLDAGDSAGAGAVARLVAGELGDGGREPVVALRGGRRWLPDYESVPVPADAREPDPAGTAAVGTGATAPDSGTAPPPLRERGVYLVTGGLGGIGLAMAERLARDCRARLVLVGRTGLPSRDTWDAILADPTVTDEVRRRVTGVRGLEERGAEVAVVTGDIADPATARAAVATARERFGALHGVLHAAGLPGIGLMQFKTESEMAKVMAPKIAGTRALEDALAGAGADFLVLFSSVTSATGGGPGQLDYCAANAYLDIHAHAAARRPGALRTVSIGWGEWQWNAWEAGMAGYDPEMRDYFRENRATFGIGFDAGWRALLRSLELGQPHVVVSTQDFAAMARDSTLFNVETIGKARDTWLDGAHHPRPDLLTPYVAPAGETETAIAEVWAQMLGLERVGTADSFFALGGNSLTGMEVMARIRRRLDVDDLPPHVLYEAPTVSAMARYVEGGDATHQEPPAGERARGDQRRAGLRRARKNRKTAGE
ncbi:type I polyketide synthase [Streptomyces bohaiensis]|uniref:SDR family NAD(P)-dependent oxidoreductase n=3 Tax=Streptomyces bohaiensis TaxID=1431344 RepID=A0ABX1CDM9_9ACTN|nr:type I polyketide synthase [Streptomyces bohaiensis]NJQ15279.1 SDR family NAD(P)-dependent oxidoreductase [Streptomyces bohaiensis]